MLMKNSLLFGLLALCVTLLSVACTESGDAEAAFERNDVEALTAMAEAGDPVAQTNLGKMYKGRFMLEPVADYAIAVSWFRKAADQGYAEGQSQLAGMYATGKGITENDAIAVSWYRKAADQGYTWAQVELAGMYKEGWGIKQDPVAAVSWYRKAIDEGKADPEAVAWAYYELGKMYEYGEGIKQDFAAALSSYRKAADTSEYLVQEKLEPAYEFGKRLETADPSSSADTKGLAPTSGERAYAMYYCVREGPSTLRRQPFFYRPSETEAQRSLDGVCNFTNRGEAVISLFQYND